MSSGNTVSSNVVNSETETNDGSHSHKNSKESLRLVPGLLHPSMIACMTIHVQVIRGRDLVAKDRKARSLLTGFKKEAAMTSDPYVKVIFQDRKYGKTRTITKNCVNPVWEETIVIELTANEARDCLQHIYDNNSNDGVPLSTIDCIVYDHDTLSFDDCMGIVQIPFTRDLVDINRRSEPQWYPVVNQQHITSHINNNNTPKTSTLKEVCHNATGDLYICIHVEQQSMFDLHMTIAQQLPNADMLFSLSTTADGDNNTATIAPAKQHILNDAKNDTASRASSTSTSGRYDIEIAWDEPVVQALSSSLLTTIIDIACVSMDQNIDHGSINFNDSVYYNNNHNLSASIIRRNGDSTIDHTTTDIRKKDGSHVGIVAKRELYQVSLRSIPSNIPVLVLCAFVAGNPATNPQCFTESILSSMTLRIINTDTKIGVCAYRFSNCINSTTFNNDNHNSKPTALIVAQLTRESEQNENHNTWTIQPVPQLQQQQQQQQQPGDKITSTNSSGMVFVTNEKGRDFGTISPEIKECVFHNNCRGSRKILPNMTLNPNEPRIAMIRKNDTICINDYVSDEQISLEHGLEFACQWTCLSLESHWSLRHNLVAILLDEHYDCMETISDRQRQSNFNGGCVRQGSKQHTTEEHMNVLLSGGTIPTDVKYILFVLETQLVVSSVLPDDKHSVHSYASHISYSVSCNVRNPITNQNIAMYRQPDPTSIPTQSTNRSAVVLGCLYRKNNTNDSIGSNNSNGNEWQYHIVDERINNISSSEQSTNVARKRIQERDSILHYSVAATSTATTESVIPLSTTIMPTTATTVVDDTEEPDIEF